MFPPPLTLLVVEDPNKTLDEAFAHLLNLAKANKTEEFKKYLKSLDLGFDPTSFINRVEAGTENTLLHIAAAVGNRDIVTLLLEKGADLWQINQEGEEACRLVPANCTELKTFFDEQGCLVAIYRNYIQHCDFDRIPDDDLDEILKFSEGFATIFVPLHRHLMDILVNNAIINPDYASQIRDLLKRIFAKAPTFFKDNPVCGKILLQQLKKAELPGIISTLIKAGANPYYPDPVGAGAGSTMSVRGAVPEKATIIRWAVYLADMSEFIGKVVFIPSAVRNAYLGELFESHPECKARIPVIEALDAFYFNMWLRLNGNFEVVNKAIIDVLSDRKKMRGEKIPALKEIQGFPEFIGHLHELDSKAKKQNNYTLEECFELYQALLKPANALVMGTGLSSVNSVAPPFKCDRAEVASYLSC